jgi:hypothetical protein
MDLCWFFIIVLTIFMGFLSNWTCSSYLFKCTTCEQQKRCEGVFSKKTPEEAEVPSTADGDDFMGGG